MSGLAPVLLSGPISVVMANYDFTGFSLASSDADPLSAASNLGSSGLGTLGYANSGNLAPALRLAASDMPNSFSAVSYLRFTITPSPGYVLSLDRFSLDATRIATFTGSYTANFEVRSSVDSFTAAVLSGTIASTSPGFTTYSTSLGPSFVNLASIEFRIYLWDSNNGSRNGIWLDNVRVTGSSVIIPEPPTWLAATTLGAVAWALGVWRRRAHATLHLNGTGSDLPQRA